MAVPGMKRPVVAAIAAALLLLLTAGFRLDGGTGIYSVPSALDDPAQSQSIFYQNLHRIAGFAWPPALRAGIDADLHGLFVAASLIAAFVVCLALLRIVARLVAMDKAGLAAGALLIGVTWLVSGHTVLSREPLFGGDFSAAQIAIALVVLSLACAVDGSLGVAVGLLGAAFDANSAVALWGVAGLAGASVMLMRDGVSVARAWLIGGACALILAAPAVWAWHAQGAGGDLFGNSVAYAGAADPGPSQVGILPLDCWVLFCSTVVLGLSACSAIGADARTMRGAFIGFAVVFAVGCALPFLASDNPWAQPFIAAAQGLLRLRPMTADTILQLLAAAAATAVVLRDLRNGGGVLRVALSVTIAVCLLLHRNLVPLAALAMLTRAAAAHGELLGLERRIPDFNGIVVGRVAVGIVFAAAVAGGALRSGLLLHG